MLLALTKAHKGIATFNQDRLSSVELADAGSFNPSVQGLKLIVDAWGRPLTFYRWPLGVAGSELAASNPNPNNYAISDPLDPNGLLISSRWNTPAAYSGRAGVWAFEKLCHLVGSGKPVSYYTVPVVASAGLSTDGQNNVYQMMGLDLPQPPDYPPAAGLPAALLPVPMNIANGTPDSWDNIYSFRMRWELEEISWMYSGNSLSSANRSGFTLVEMLVVLGIILLLAVTTVLFMPRIQEQQRVRQGADLLQGWLLMAKQRALRDRIPTGIRLQRSAQNPNYVQDLQYIQKPDDYAQGVITGWKANHVLFTGTDFLGPAGDTVQPGDYLLVRGEGLPSLITQVQPPSSLSVMSSIQASPLQPGTQCSYQIERQPRPLAGEQPLQLPQDVIINVTPGKSLNVPARAPFAGEILFTPSGRVIGQGSGSAPIALWLAMPLWTPTSLASKS